MADGKVEYEIRADDSSLESDLASAQAKIISSENTASSKRESIEKSTSSTLKNEKEEVADYHEKQNDQIVDADQDSADKRESIENAVGEKIKSAASTTCTAVATSFLAIGTAAVAVGAMAVSGAVDLDSAMNSYIAATGTSIDETERYQNVLENIYTNNYGESFEDIAQSMATVTQSLGEMSDESLQEITESAYALQDTFEYDISESVRAAKAMMDNFGVSGEDAMSMIAAGAQNGLDYSGELIDSISEYSTYFSTVGLDADAMFQIFETGAETGAWNLDKVGDAVKEFSIRAVDASDTTAEGFGLLGLDADDMAAKFAEGGEVAEEAFKQTLDALAAMEDPIAQNTAGVDLFGTTWEDLGADVVTSLGDISDGAYDTADALDTIKEVKYDDFGSMLEATSRALEMLLIPLGEALIPILTELIDEVLPILEETLPIFTDLIADMMPFISDLISSLLPVLVDIFNQLTEVVAEMLPYIMELIEGILPIMVELFEKLAPPILVLIEELLPVFLELFEALLPILDVLIALLDPIITLFLNMLPPIIDLIENAIVPFIEIIGELLTYALAPLQDAIILLGSIWTEKLQGMMSDASSIIQALTSVFSGFIDFIAGVFTGDWERAWDGIKSIFSGIVSGFSTIFKSPINAIIDGINTFISGVNAIKIPDWVPEVGGLSLNIASIPKLRVGIDYVPEDDYPALLHMGEAVLTAEENAMLQNIGGINSLYAYANAPSISDIDDSNPTKGGGGSGDGGGDVYQTININQKVQTPDETARAIRTETRLNNIYD